MAVLVWLSDVTRRIVLAAPDLPPAPRSQSRQVVRVLKIVSPILSLLLCTAMELCSFPCQDAVSGGKSAARTSYWTNSRRLMNHLLKNAQHRDHASFRRQAVKRSREKIPCIAEHRLAPALPSGTSVNSSDQGHFPCRPGAVITPNRNLTGLLCKCCSRTHSVAVPIIHGSVAKRFSCAFTSVACVCRMRRQVDADLAPPPLAWYGRACVQNSKVERPVQNPRLRCNN